MSRLHRDMLMEHQNAMDGCLTGFEVGHSQSRFTRLFRGICRAIAARPDAG